MSQRAAGFTPAYALADVIALLLLGPFFNVVPGSNSLFPVYVGGSWRLGTATVWASHRFSLNFRTTIRAVFKWTVLHTLLVPNCVWWQQERNYDADRPEKQTERETFQTAALLARKRTANNAA
jgi:hypothetical protein